VHSDHPFDAGLTETHAEDLPAVSTSSQHGS
jgi:hypothetical protein